VVGGREMRFSSKELYGLRAMIELARHYPEGPVPLSNVAKARDLPLPYLEQIASSLRKAGLIESIRGARGGYKLSRAPGKISIGDVFRALEGRLVTLPCHLQENCGIFEDAECYCTKEVACAARDVWEQVHSLMSGVLDKITLADLIAQ